MLKSYLKYEPGMPSCPSAVPLKTLISTVMLMFAFSRHGARPNHHRQVPDIDRSGLCCGARMARDDAVESQVRACPPALAEPAWTSSTGTNFPVRRTSVFHSSVESDCPGHPTSLAVAKGLAVMGSSEGFVGNMPRALPLVFITMMLCPSSPSSFIAARRSSPAHQPAHVAHDS